MCGLGQGVHGQYGVFTNWRHLLHCKAQVNRVSGGLALEIAGGVVVDEGSLASTFVVISYSNEGGGVALSVYY